MYQINETNSIILYHLLLIQGAEFCQVAYTRLWDGQSLSIANEQEMFIVLNFGYDSRKEEKKNRKRRDLLAGQNFLEVGGRFE